MHIKHLLLTALIASLPCIAASGAEIPADKRQEIEKLLRLIGVESRMTQKTTVVITSLKSQIPNAPPDFWTKFEQKIQTRDLLDKLMPIYDKYFTTEDLKAVNTFYESPAGQRILSMWPQLMQESMKIGTEWGQTLSKQALDEAAQASKKTQ